MLLVILAWANFLSLTGSLVLFGYLYLLSVQPVARVARHGEKGWAECKRLRLVASLFEFVSFVNIILWIFVPLPGLNWLVHPWWWPSFLIGLGIACPGIVLMLKGARDAGSETLTPSGETEMYGGIYEYIRHPQTLGEFPLWVAIAFAINSWFLILVTLVFIVVYTPFMIHYEEKDLVRRFGDKYLEYQRRTGALFPKFRKKEQ